MRRKDGFGQFNEDVDRYSGYVYTADDRLSCRLANIRMTEAILDLAEVAGQRVIDVGCGDGAYTVGLLDAGALEVVGFDAAEQAVEVAQRRAADRSNLHFEVGEISTFSTRGKTFDVAIVRGLLHHLDDVEQAVARIASLARRAVVVEPNGYNPILKVIERISPYHRAHQERSFSPRLLDRWFVGCGGRIEHSLFVGLVPMFCPEPLARLLKRLEPIVERLPVIRAVCCGQYVQRVSFD